MAWISFECWWWGNVLLRSIMVNLRRDRHLEIFYDIYTYAQNVFHFSSACQWQVRMQVTNLKWDSRLRTRQKLPEESGKKWIWIHKIGIQNSHELWKSIQGSWDVITTLHCCILTSVFTENFSVSLLVNHPGISYPTQYNFSDSSPRHVHGLMSEVEYFDLLNSDCTCQCSQGINHQFDDIRISQSIEKHAVSIYKIYSNGRFLCTLTDLRGMLQKLVLHIEWSFLLHFSFSFF